MNDELYKLDKYEVLNMQDDYNHWMEDEDDSQWYIYE